jgi:hypothetical protein
MVTASRRGDVPRRLRLRLTGTKALATKIDEFADAIRRGEKHAAHHRSAQAADQ